VAPDTMQQNETESEYLDEPIPEPVKPKGPEWWTEENTRAWNLQQWGDPAGRSAAQVAWNTPVTSGQVVAPPKSRATLCAVIPAETMAQWRLTDPRPANAFYYDGTPITNYQPLRVKKPRARKVAA
jgi:hypothetical protein